VYIIGPQGWPAVLVGIQKPAKRPETNKGGREEEEKRLGIAARSRGSDRLRSAKKNSVAGADTRLQAERNHRPKKFRKEALEAIGRAGGQTDMVVWVLKIDRSVLL
jgi:tellurite resistance protein